MPSTWAGNRPRNPHTPTAPSTPAMIMSDNQPIGVVNRNAVSSCSGFRNFVRASARKSSCMLIVTILSPCDGEFAEFSPYGEENSHADPRPLQARYQCLRVLTRHRFDV